MELTSYIRAIPDFPKPGILFRDITPLLSAPAAFRLAVSKMCDIVSLAKVDKLIAIESRGFLFAAPIAHTLSLPLVPVRKPGKLPAEKKTIEYALEYGNGSLDIHADSVSQGERVAVIDDLLATGGTASGAEQLVKACGGEVAVFAFLIELKALGGAARLGQSKVSAVLCY